MRQMSPVCKMADNERLTVDQKVKVVLFYAETRSVVPTQRCFRAHFGTRWAPCKQTIYRLSLGTIFQPMKINSVPDVNAFVKIKMCYVYNQWYDISCATLYLQQHHTRYQPCYVRRKHRWILPLAHKLQNSAQARGRVVNSYTLRRQSALGLS